MSKECIDSVLFGVENYIEVGQIVLLLVLGFCTPMFGVYLLGLSLFLIVLFMLCLQRFLRWKETRKILKTVVKTYAERSR